MPSIHSQKGKDFSFALCCRSRSTRCWTSCNYTLYCKSLTHFAELGPGDEPFWVPLGFGACDQSSALIPQVPNGKVLVILWVVYRAACRRACSAAPGSSLGWWWRRTASWEPGTAETTLPAGGWGRTSGSAGEEREKKQERALTLRPC